MKFFQKFPLVLFPILFSMPLFSEPNPPTWPASVTVCDPSNQAATQTALNAVYATNGGPNSNGQFTGTPHAFLFMPGNHNTIEAKVGYYTSIIGLGNTPTDTTIQHVHQSDTAQSGSHLSVTDIFWRSAENFTQGQDSLTWAVSQACPLRNVHANELHLSKNGAYASGGFFANCQFNSFVDFSPQQQWFGRNSHIGKINGGISFNLVLVGCTYTTTPTQGPPKYTFISQKTPTIAEKPYITIDGGGLYYLQIPTLVSSVSGTTSGTSTVNFNDVYVATSADTAATINGKIASGLHVVLTPGTYSLTEPIVINTPDIILLGIGFPILEANNATACIEVGDVEGVRVGGVLLQATSTTSNHLLKWGSTNSYTGNPSKPGILSDCFTRVGGPNNSVTNPVSSNIMIEINSGNVILDNIWAWRADHDIQGLVRDENNPCLNGLVVNGESVTSYGLAAEHTLNDITVWNGNKGKVFFYQAEYPYDANTDYGDNQYVAYRVGSNVTEHQSYGVGVYSFFLEHNVIVENGVKIDAPLKLNNNIHFTNIFTWFIGGQGQIKHTIQGVGTAVSSIGNTSYINNFPSTILVSKSSMVNRFFTQSEKCDELSWSTPLDDPQPGGLTYKILTVPNYSQVLRFFPSGSERKTIIHNLPHSSNNTYWIVSENKEGLTAFGKSN